MTDIYKQIITGCLVFLVGGILGHIFEYYIINKKECNRVLDKVFDTTCFPFLPMYALGGVFLYAMSLYGPKSLLVASLLSAAILTGFECATGLIKESLYKRGWDYRKHTFNGCNGYISMRVSLLWLLFSFISIYSLRTFISVEE